MAKTEKNKEIIKLRDLKKRFGVGDAENYALNGVDLSVKQGEFIIIMGPSGCGKTTLLNILDCLIARHLVIIFLTIKMLPNFRAVNTLIFVAKKSVLYSKVLTLFPA